MKSLDKDVPEFLIRYLNTTSLAGILVFSVAVIICYLGISTITRSSFIVFDRDLQFAKGSVISVRATSFGAGGEMTHLPIFEIGFEYQVGDETHTNLGYTSSNYISLGDQLDISYKQSDPNISKAASLKASPFGVLVLLGVFLPWAGVIIFLKGLKWGNEFILLIKDGTIVRAQLLSVVESSDEEYKHFYVYEDRDGKRRRLGFESFQKEADEEAEIIYDESAPERAEILKWDNLPILFGRNTIKQALRGS